MRSDFSKNILCTKCIYILNKISSIHPKLEEACEQQLTSQTKHDWHIYFNTFSALSKSLYLADKCLFDIHYHWVNTHKHCVDQQAPVIRDLMKAASLNRYLLTLDIYSGPNVIRVLPNGKKLILNEGGDTWFRFSK